jgi:SAM-dependent methyltransferase
MNILPATGPITHKCHLCGSSQLRLISAYHGMSRVTSDCQPWPSGGTLGVCEDCHLVQTSADARWEAEIKRIYGQYLIYHQSGGVEQSVFAVSGDGAGKLRSEVIVQALLKHHSLPKQGTHLDLGCGNGAFLRAASAALPGWSLHASEWDDKHIETLAAIPGFQTLHTGSWETIPGTYDLISMVHVLEHIVSPLTVLGTIRRLLAPGGVLLIEVPNCVINPYMLLIADHCSHFSKDGLSALVTSAGFEVLQASDTWVQKELTIIARASLNTPPAVPVLPEADAVAIIKGVHKLETIQARASVAAVAAPATFGIFGTSIAATWLDSQLGSAVTFFVDEDPNRSTGSHLGKPILSPERVPPGASVFIALPQPLAGQVAARLALFDVKIMMPED